MLQGLTVSELPYAERRYFLFPERGCGRLVYYDEIEKDFDDSQDSPTTASARIEFFKALTAGEALPRTGRPKKKKKKKKKRGRK